MKLDESPSQIRNVELDCLTARLQSRPVSELLRVQFKISDLGFETGFHPISKFFVFVDWSLELVVSGSVPGLFVKSTKTGFGIDLRIRFEVLHVSDDSSMRKKLSDARFVKCLLDRHLVSTYTGDPCLPTSRSNFVT